MPSNDYRLRDAAGDIRQHRESFMDWPADWVFTDDRFRLLWCPDEDYLRFLCETVHPIVRPDAVEARSLASEINALIRADGWELIEKGAISGKPLFAAAKAGGGVRIVEEPTGWPKVDRQLQEVRVRLDSAQTEEHFQAVGLLCREVLISVGQAVFVRGRHDPVDGVVPSDTDAKRLLEAFFKSELAGSANEEARGHAKAAVQLALALQHKRTADWRTAAICAEATASVANLAAILAKHSRSPGPTDTPGPLPF